MDVSVIGQILSSNMGVVPGERVLIVNDIPSAADWSLQPVARLEALASRSMLARTVADVAGDYHRGQVDLEVFAATHRSGTEPPQEVARAMTAAEVVLLITTYSLTHTRAVARAAAAGARIASMPGLTSDIIRPGGPLSEDSAAMVLRSAPIVNMLTSATAVHLTTAAGTDLRLSLRSQAAGIDSGLLSTSGAVGNLPAGEVYIAPEEGTATGRLVVAAGADDLILVFDRGRVVSVSGGGVRGERLRTLLLDDPDASHRCNCAELGVGVNFRADKNAATLEAEKAAGTVHIAVGDNKNLGGKVVSDIHIDFVIAEPTLVIDGRKLLEAGIMDETLHYGQKDT